MHPLEMDEYTVYIAQHQTEETSVFTQKSHLPTTPVHGLTHCEKCGYDKIGGICAVTRCLSAKHYGMSKGKLKEYHNSFNGCIVLLVAYF